MSTYRERRETKADRLRGWADGRDAKAAALHARNEPYRGDIAFNTQPGHIPERARVLARTERAWQHSERAADMRSRADGIDAAAANAIYSDDIDAVERLQAKIAELEAQRARIKAYNASCRKGSRDLTLLDDAQRAELASLARVAAFQIGPKGEFPRYASANLSGLISKTRQRLERLMG